jgi:RNA polymerase sigma-70 factor (ECF subfamily)
VHRATAARWLTRAREDLFDGTVAELSQRLNLPAPEIDSVIRIIGSQLDASVTRILRSEKS